jgi:Ser/Thr protein kinase RdoA (MazF antagonist)
MPRPVVASKVVKVSPDAWPVAIASIADRVHLHLVEEGVSPCRIEYEHALLARLEQLGLSFAVPAPIPRHSGATLAEVGDGAGRALAALFRFIAGRHPDAGNRVQARVCVEALGELDVAFSCIDIRPPAGTLPAFGDLSHVHPAVPDPVAMLEELPLPQEERAQLVGILQELLAMAPRLYSSLPQQIVHRDFDGSKAADLPL